MANAYNCSCWIILQGKLGQVSLTKRKQRVETTKAIFEKSKQSTLDDLSFQFNIQKPNLANKTAKQIVVNNVSYVIDKDELALKVEFTLLPSKLAFSKINLDIYFEDQLLKSIILGIPQSSLLNDDFDFPILLDMLGIRASKYLIRVEMFELWPTGEKLCFTSKEIVVEYVPKTIESRLLKIPIVKSVAGSNIAVVSSSEKSVYLDIEQDLKNEYRSRRDEW